MRKGRPWAVLVGAGPSTGVGLPDWEDLLRNLGGLGGPGVPDTVAPNALPTALGRTLSAVGPEAFWTAVKNRVCGGASGEPEAYKSLASLPFNVFTTTNYDHLLRDAFLTDADLQGDLTVLSYPDIAPTHLSQRCLIQLHGCCHQIDERQPGTEPPIVLTQEQYDVAYSPDGTLPNVLRRLFTDFQVLMLGTSLQDGRLTAVLQEARYLSEREGRAGGPLPSGVHMALAGSPVREGPGFDMDLTWGGLGIGVDPIFYFNPPESDHEGLIEALRFLDNSLGINASAQFGIEGN